MIEQHEHPELKRELNGFGERLNKAEVCMAEVKTRAHRSEEDIQSIFSLVERNASQLGSVQSSLAGLTGKIGGAVAIIMILVSVLIKLAERLVP